MAETEVNLSVLKRNIQNTPAKAIRFHVPAASACSDMEGATSTANENGGSIPLTVIEEVSKDPVQIAPRPVVSVPSTGSTGYLTIVNVRGSEESFGVTSPPTKEDKGPSESEEPYSPKGPAVHDHNYSLALSVRGRPLRRSKGCGLCDGCKRPNCDKCRFCMDKPKNGGPNRLKKRCVLRVCTNMVVSPPFCHDNLHFTAPRSFVSQHVQSPTRLRAQTLSASSAGMSGEDEPEQDNDVITGSMTDEQEELAAASSMDAESKHTTVVMVDDPNNPADRPKRQKILPKKLTANNAMEFLDRKPRVTVEASPELHFGRRTRMMTAGRSVGALRKTRSEISLRTLRRRPGPKPDGVCPDGVSLLAKYGIL